MYLRPIMSTPLRPISSYVYVVKGKVREIKTIAINKNTERKVKERNTIRQE